MLNGRDDVIVT